MPEWLPTVPGLSFGAQYQPGGLNTDVGGDWYDIIDLSDGSTAIAIGDVTGKGVAAAIAMSEVRAALRAYAVLDATPSVVLSRLDDFVTARNAPDHLVTAVYGVVSADRRAVTVAAAGHPPPLLVSPRAATRTLEDGLGPALGIGSGPWPDITVEIEAQSTVLLYSDGLVAARSSDLFRGIDQLVGHIDALSRRRRRARDLCADVHELMVPDEADDDVTMLAVTVVPDGSVVSAGTALPADTTAPSIARRFVHEQLTQWELQSSTVTAAAGGALPNPTTTGWKRGSSREDLTDTAELCVSELVTNAVIHTGSTAQLTLELDEECLTVLVRDQGGSGAVERGADEEPLRVSGRGLGLVQALAASWSVERDSEGTTVWFELDRFAEPYDPDPSGTALQDMEPMETPG